MTAHAKGNVIEYVRAVLRPGDVCLDGGANRGSVASEMAKAVGPAGKVYAVEPDRRCAEELAALRATCPQVHVLHVALGEFASTVEFYQARNSTQSSLIQRCVSEGELEHVSRVACLRMDHFCHAAALVKLDLQGGEYAAIRGAKRLLEHCPQWVVELWPYALQQAEVTPQQFLRPFMLAHLEPHWMDDGYPKATYQDVLAYLHDEHKPNQHVNVIFSRE